MFVFIKTHMIFWMRFLGNNGFLGVKFGISVRFLFWCDVEVC